MSIAILMSLLYVGFSLLLFLCLSLVARFRTRWLVKKLGERMTEKYGRMTTYRVPVQLTEEEQAEFVDLDALHDEWGLSRTITFIWAIYHLPGLLCSRLSEERGSVSAWKIMLCANAVCVGLVWLVYFLSQLVGGPG